MRPTDIVPTARPLFRTRCIKDVCSKDEPHAGAAWPEADTRAHFFDFATIATSASSDGVLRASYEQHSMYGVGWRKKGDC